jgi:MerR family copper efflux transcriptional regulator
VTGLAPKTIRFYEEKGLIPRPRRTASGYRTYASDDLRRLSLVRRYRALGFRLSEVRKLVRLAEDKPCDSFQSELAHELDRKLTEVDALIERLGATRLQISALAECLSENTCGDCQQTALECLDECGPPGREATIRIEEVRADDQAHARSGLSLPEVLPAP